MTLNHSLTIALVVNLYPPYIIGGNEILARDVTEALRQRGHTVHILTGRGAQLPQDGFTHSPLDIDLDHKEDIFLGGLPLTWGRVLKWHLYNHQSYLGVRRLLDELRPDLLIAWNLYGASAAPLVAARHFAFPVIAHPADKWLLYNLHDVRPLAPSNRRTAQLATNALVYGVQPVLRRLGRIDYLLTVSQFIRALHLAVGYPSAQSRATYLGVHTERFTFQPHAFPGKRRWRLMFAGQLWWGKGPQVAIEAVHHLRAQPEPLDIELEIYGGGVDAFVQHLHSLIAQWGLEDRVRIHGFAPQAMLAQAMHQADIFLFCSIWDEPFSGGLLEAMSTGIPTIATTAGGTPEAVRHAENGLMTPPGDVRALADAITRLMHDAELYERIGGQAAQDVQERWTFTHYIDRLEALYRSIVTNHRPDAPIEI